jgi:hypothetical protein
MTPGSSPRSTISSVSFLCLEPLGLLGFPPWQPGRLWPSRLLAKGLDEVCAWLHKAALTPFPPVTKLSRTTVTERTRLGQELNCGTSAASLSESSCLLHESRTNIIVIMDLRPPVESAHDSASRVGVRERLDLASAPASRRRTRFSLSHPPTPWLITDPIFECALAAVASSRESPRRRFQSTASCAGRFTCSYLALL